MLVFDICGTTHRGRVRQHNEDHILVGRFVKNAGQLALSVYGDDDYVANYGLLLTVADGIGGAAGGELASRLALQTLDKAFYTGTNADARLVVSLLRRAADCANSRVREVAAKSQDYANMGSTLGGICLVGEQYWTFNAGDSRVYRYRNGVLKPLSNDDTLVTRAVRSGAMTFAQAAHSSDRHILTNYLGAAEFRLAVDAGPELREGDSLLVCSDGLYDVIDDDTLAECLQQFNASGFPSAEQTGRLLALANERGGGDNISLILMRVCR
jgi:protein phosphatase